MNTYDKKGAGVEPEPPAEDLHPSDILAALHKAGWTLESLGHHHGLTSGQTLSKALRTPMPIGEKRIAEALNMHPKEIWPSRYHQNGERKLHGFRAIQSTRKRVAVNGKDEAINSHA